MSQAKYQNYDALWPLCCMGVLNEDHSPNGWDIDASAERKSRVAVIDTSVAVDHPNLKDAINRSLAFDLFSTRLGAFPYRPADEKIGPITLNTSTNVTSGQPHVTELLAELIDRLSPNSTAWIGKVQPTVSADFSSHGTAICGIIGARPIKAALTEGYQEPATGHGKVPLPYTGVDPSCEIVPISTNFDPSPNSLILAFLYAELIDADVILVPRTIPDPTRTVPELTENLGGTMLRDLVAPTENSMMNLQAWDELAQLISNISLSRPIICAGGNGQEDGGIYPANLASEHNGVISVGAVNAKGYRSGYSPSRAVTVMGPSDDSEIFDRTEIRLDERRHDYSSLGVPPGHANLKFSHYEVISTDVPGTYGYSSSPFPGEEPEAGLREFGSYFCRFGGTSAASAFVAGFLALGKSSGALHASADGLDAKTWLMSRCAVLNDGDDEFLFPAWDGTAHFPDRLSERSGDAEAGRSSASARKQKSVSGKHDA